MFKSRDYIQNYFGLPYMFDKKPHRVHAYVKTLTEDHRYTTPLSALYAPEVSKRYLSIVEPFLAPFAVHMSFSGTGASTNLERDLRAISTSYISFLCTAMHNVLKQWASGTPNPRGGLGNAVNQAGMYSISLH